MSEIKVETDIVADDAYSVKLLTKPNPNTSALVVKAECKNAEVKKHITQKKTALAKLPDDHALKRVFLKSDEPKMTRRENERLRRKRATLASTHDNVTLRQGKLSVDGNVVDEFNLANQLYPSGK